MDKSKRITKENKQKPRRKTTQKDKERNAKSSSLKRLKDNVILDYLLKLPDVQSKMQADKASWQDIKATAIKLALENFLQAQKTPQKNRKIIYKSLKKGQLLEKTRTKFLNALSNLLSCSTEQMARGEKQWQGYKLRGRQAEKWYGRLQEIIQGMDDGAEENSYGNQITVQSEEEEGEEGEEMGEQEGSGSDGGGQVRQEEREPFVMRNGVAELPVQLPLYARENNSMRWGGKIAGALNILLVTVVALYLNQTSTVSSTTVAFESPAPAPSQSPLLTQLLTLPSSTPSSTPTPTLQSPSRFPLLHHPNMRDTPWTIDNQTLLAQQTQNLIKGSTVSDNALLFYTVFLAICVGVLCVLGMVGYCVGEIYGKWRGRRGRARGRREEERGREGAFWI